MRHIYALLMFLSVAGKVSAAELDGPDSVQLGQPIIFQIDEPGSTIWHVFPSGAVSQREFGSGELAIWASKATRIEVLAVHIPENGKPEKLTKFVTIGDVEDGPVDTFGLIKVAENARKDLDPVLARLLSQSFRGVAADFRKTPPEGTLVEQVAALQTATVESNRAAIDPSERPAVVPALEKIMEAINANKEIDTFDDYLTAWEAVAHGLRKE